MPSPPDLCCMEDGWDKDSPSKAAASFPRVAAAAAAARPQAGAAATASDDAARIPTPTPSERAQLRRARPVDPTASAGGSRSSFSEQRTEEGVASLLKMFEAQRKFLPAGVTGSAGSRARCHGVSPFVAEHRKLFVAWEVRATQSSVGGWFATQGCCCLLLLHKG